MIRIEIELFDINSRSQILRKDGAVPKRLRVLSISSLTDKDHEKLKSNRDGLKYCPILKK